MRKARLQNRERREVKRFEERILFSAFVEGNGSFDTSSEARKEYRWMLILMKISLRCGRWCKKRMLPNPLNYGVYPS